MIVLKHKYIWYLTTSYKENNEHVETSESHLAQRCINTECSSAEIGDLNKDKFLLLFTDHALHTYCNCITLYESG